MHEVTGSPTRAFGDDGFFIGTIKAISFATAAPYASKLQIGIETKEARMYFLSRWLLLAATFTSACFAADTPLQPASALVCPAPTRAAPPVYPSNELRAGRGGKVVMQATFDECGRVLEVFVTQKSGSKPLDNAAVASIKPVVFSEEARTHAVDGKLEQSVTFTADVDGRVKKVDWPKTHKNPRYVLDDEAIPYATVAIAFDSIKESEPDVFRPPVIDFRHRWVQVDTPQGREFWLFLYSKANVAAVAARYRPVMEPDGAVVRLAIQCELEKPQCEAIQDMLLKGFAFAKAK